MIIKSLITSIGVVVAMANQAVAQDRFLGKVKLPKGETVVVAEGDFETRSTGSFSIRLYEAADAPDETTFFSSGLVLGRDGVIEKLMLANVNKDPQEEIVVTIRSVGTGGYLSAHAFAAVKGKLTRIASVDGLAASADPVVALRKR
jgi:hypothetical protein